MYRKAPFAEGEYYHVYNRGVEKRAIFMDHKDRLRFMQLLYLCNGTIPINLRDIREFMIDKNIYEFPRGNQLVAIGTYCMMGNHFHLLLKQIADKGISRFMQKLATAYTMYFNLKYKRSGSLFQGIFKDRHVDDDDYLKYLFAYIHLNPVEHVEPKWKESGLKNSYKAEAYLSKYLYSGLVDYAGITRPERSIIDFDAFPAYFTKHTDMKNYLKSWLDFKSSGRVEEDLAYLMTD